MKKLDLIGKKFGRLIPIKQMGKNKHGQCLWLCLCDCKEKITVAGSDLKRGNTKSCGCLRKENKGIIKHGHSRKRKISKTYRAWRDMKQRCNNPNHIEYKNYGGRTPSITVCKRWSNKRNGFQNFLYDMGECPPGLSLDRINNNLGYYKENCRWTTLREQNRNTRQNINYDYNNKKQCLTDLSEEHNIKRSTLNFRLNVLKWSIKKALETPVRKYKKRIKKCL